MATSINFKGIDQLTQKSTIAGTEKFPVSDTQYVTANQIASLGGGGGGGGGDTSDCVHKTGDETIAGDKTFTDDIVVGDASNIVYGASAGSGFTRGTSSQWWDYPGSSSIQIGGDNPLLGEPKAFVLSAYEPGSGVLMVVGDSTGCHGVYNTGSQHNYSASFTKSYSSGVLTITAPTGVTFITDISYNLTYYYGDGTLTFKTAQVTPGSGVTSVTFTGTGLTEVPSMYACFLETAVNNEQYRRVAGYTNCAYSALQSAVVSEGITFLTGGPVDTTSSFSVSYNNGLVINSGGTNAGGYFHNPGTYTLYYLTASDIGGGGGGSYADLAAELSAMSSSISGKEASSNKVTSISAQSTDTQYPSAKLLYDQLALKQAAITISSSEPTQYQGNNGDIWIVI